MPEERVRMVFGVVLAMDNADRFLKPGMPADAWIRWDDARQWPAKLTVPR
jgi:HlyD family secretion protein